ncbi:MAG: DNA adenine methylase, partial [Ruminococcaceae bacterium]|nr:DNA adenine methylase [Oscillospiraceae bacterium]
FKLQYTLQRKRSSSEVMFFSKNLQRPTNEGSLINILTE